ncbi:hypothetical protein GM3708_1435 [Geminocystis sp. NIES-3708]|nr:hypothetical protein GM3708_1435 [Geminocystis sp. NIES-3708]
MNNKYYQISAIIEKNKYGYYAYCFQLEGSVVNIDWIP